MLVMSETLKGNRINGILISLSPLLTDLPIILISVYSLQLIADIDLIYGLLSIAGGLFLIYLGIQNFKFDPQKSVVASNYRISIKNGIITNLLSPHPYIFWLIIGAPTFVKAGKSSTLSQALFIIGFYVLLIGSKIAVAIIAAKAKDFLQSSTYTNITKVMGLIFLVLASVMIYDGIGLLNSSS